VDTSTWNDLFLAHWAGSDRPAIVTPDGSWTGEELLHRAAGSAAWLDELGFAVVVGVPDRRWGEIVKAVIVARDPADPPSADDLVALTRARLAHHKVPAVIEIIDELPRNPSGKVLRRRLVG
jgi:acyl-CoA synthetase (AMP-forming)/AMP-acid ligase II